MALRAHNPSRIAPPTGLYSHGIEVPPNARWLYITGQVGIDRQGRAAPTIDKQCALAWANLLAVLKSAGMDVGDLVRVNAFLTDPRFVEAYRAARDPLLGDARPASTVLVVAALADPAFLVEIDAVAARA
jgi:2-iminobutanoate/2-iminopropanoate deaminase